MHKMTTLVATGIGSLVVGTIFGFFLHHATIRRRIPVQSEGGDWVGMFGGNFELTVDKIATANDAADEFFRSEFPSSNAKIAVIPTSPHSVNTVIYNPRVHINIPDEFYLRLNDRLRKIFSEELESKE